MVNHFFIIALRTFEKNVMRLPFFIFVIRYKSEGYKLGFFSRTLIFSILFVFCYFAPAIKGLELKVKESCDMDVKKIRKKSMAQSN